MVKRKPKKVRNAIAPENQEKIEKLKQLLAVFKSQADEYEKYLNGQCIARCDRIEKLYQDNLKSIPENIRNMTITQVMELQEKAALRETECPRNENAFRMQHERSKMTSERKRTQRKEKREKRSISAPASSRSLSRVNHPIMNNVPRISRNVSELSLITPLAKQKKTSMTAVTPKFNPNRPILAARKPKPGETVMSLSGSPIHNYMDDLPPDKPVAKVTLSLGHGKIITLSDNAEVDSEKEFLKTIDEPLKTAIQNVKEQLEEILKA